MPEDIPDIKEFDPHIQVGVKVLIKDPDTDKFLLIRRNPEKYPEAAGLWTIPGGRWEHDKDRHIKDVAYRETLEETGLEIGDYIRTVAYQNFRGGRKNENEVTRVTCFVEAKGIPRVDKTENIEAKWLSINEIRDLEDNLDIYLKELIDKNQIK